MNLWNIYLFVISMAPLCSSSYFTWHVEEENNTLPDSTQQRYIDFFKYTPLKPWQKQDYDSANLRFVYRPFKLTRIADFSGYKEPRGVLTTHFQHFRDLDPGPDTCRPLDTATVMGSYRYHTYSGFRTTLYDSFYNYRSYRRSHLPFARNVDAVFIDFQKRQHLVYVSNNRFYAFDTSNAYIRQGLLRYYWKDYNENYVDAVLSLSNGHICRFYGTFVHCTNHDRPHPIESLFQPAPSLLLKAAFQFNSSTIVLMDMNDTAWFYEKETHTFLDSQYKCNVPLFAEADICCTCTQEECGTEHNLVDKHNDSSETTVDFRQTTVNSSEGINDLNETTVGFRQTTVDFVEGINDSANFSEGTNVSGEGSGNLFDSDKENVHLFGSGEGSGNVFDSDKENVHQIGSGDDDPVFSNNDKKVKKKLSNI